MLTELLYGPPAPAGYGLVILLPVGVHGGGLAGKEPPVDQGYVYTYLPPARGIYTYLQLSRLPRQIQFCQQYLYAQRVKHGFDSVDTQ